MKRFILIVAAGLACVPVSGGAFAQSPYDEEVTADVEEIFVFRTTRTRNQAGATPACAAAPFASASEQYFELWSVRVRPGDSRVVDTHEEEVGGFTACFGRAAQGAPLPMYAIGTTAKISWTGIGECTVLEAQPPVRTVVAFSCNLGVSGLPEGYAGGMLSSSTLAPFLGRDQPPNAHVPGYLSTSVVTLRLWKKPTAAGTVTSADGERITYEAHGSGPVALVFVHGWMCDRSYWKAQVEPFAGEFRVVTVDLAGHGESSRAREAWTMSAFGGDVAAVVEKLGLQRVVLIGHSMGGDVVVAAARKLPGRVAGLIWVDTYKTLGPPATPEQTQAFMAPFRANFAHRTGEFVRSMFPANADPVLVEQVASDMASAPPAIGLSAMQAALSYENEIPGALQELKLPVIAINPDTPASDATSLERHGVDVMTLSGVGHFLMMEDTQRFNPLLRTAIDRITTRAVAR